MKQLRKCPGLSIYEVLIVLSILIILALIAIPSYNTYIQQHRVTQNAENLLYFLKNARSEAIKRSATVYVSFQTGDSWCVGANTSSNCSCQTPSSCNLGTVSAATSQQLTLSLNGISGNSVQFDGVRGSSNTNAGKVTLTAFGQTTAMSITISQDGNTQLCGSLGGYQACP